MIGILIASLLITVVSGQDIEFDSYEDDYEIDYEYDKRSMPIINTINGNGLEGRQVTGTLNFLTYLLQQYNAYNLINAVPAQQSIPDRSYVNPQPQQATSMATGMLDLLAAAIQTYTGHPPMILSPMVNNPVQMMYPTNPTNPVNRLSVNRQVASEVSSVPDPNATQQQSGFFSAFNPMNIIENLLDFSGISRRSNPVSPSTTSPEPTSTANPVPTSTPGTDRRAVNSRGPSITFSCEQVTMSGRNLVKTEAYSFPKQISTISDPVSNDNITIKSYGYVIRDQAVIESVISGPIDSVERFYGPLNGSVEGRAQFDSNYPNYEADLDKSNKVAMTELGMMSLGSLIEQVRTEFANSNHSTIMKNVLNCQTIHLKCLLDANNKVENCSKELCACLRLADDFYYLFGNYESNQ